MSDNVKTLLDTYLRAYEYRYDPQTVLIETGCLKKKFESKNDLLTFLQQVRQEKNIIFYVPVKNQELLDALLQAGFSAQGHMHRLTIDFRDQNFLRQVRERLPLVMKREAFSKYELLHCRPSEHVGLSQLLQGYLKAHQQTFLDAFGNTQIIYDDLADYHYFEGKDHQPLGFHKVITSIFGREAEITFGQGSARQNVAMILFSLLEEVKMGTPRMEINVPYESVTNLLVHLGMRDDYAFAVLVAQKV